MSDATKNLFDGQNFFLRPCVDRKHVKNLIEKNGGRMANVHTVNGDTIRLTDHTSDKNGFHIDYILDSCNQKKKLNLGDYEVPRYSQPNVTKTHIIVDPIKLSNARQHYEPEEDDAILRYIGRFASGAGCVGSATGNAIFKAMEDKKITLHSWQSMKARYMKNLQEKQPLYDFNPLTIRLNADGEKIPFAIQNPAEIVKTVHMATSNVLSKVQPLKQQEENLQTKLSGDNNKSSDNSQKKKKTKRKKLFSTSSYLRTPKSSEDKSIETSNSNYILAPADLPPTAEEVDTTNTSVHLFEIFSSEEQANKTAEPLENIKTIGSKFDQQVRRQNDLEDSLYPKKSTGEKKTNENFQIILSKNDEKQKPRNTSNLTESVSTENMESQKTTLIQDGKSIEKTPIITSPSKSQTLSKSTDSIQTFSSPESTFILPSKCSTTVKDNLQNPTQLNLTEVNMALDFEMSDDSDSFDCNLFKQANRKDVEEQQFDEVSESSKMTNRLHQQNQNDEKSLSSLQSSINILQEIICSSIEMKDSTFQLLGGVVELTREPMHCNCYKQNNLEAISITNEINNIADDNPIWEKIAEELLLNDICVELGITDIDMKLLPNEN